MKQIKPFKQIEKTKSVINNLKRRYEYTKKEQEAKDINTLIDTVEMFNDILVSKYKTDAVDTLIYSLIYEWMMMFKVGEGNPIPIHKITYEIDNDLMYISDYKKSQILDLLKTNTLANLIKKDTLNKWDGIYPPYEILLDSLVKEFKNQLIWKRLN